eukprot:PITA_20266
MRVSLEREIQLQAVKEMLVPKEEEPQIDVEQLHAEVPGVETSTQVEFLRDGRKHTREVDRLLTDAREYWERIPLDQKSTSGGIFNLGSAAVSWYNRKQRSVALNSTEAEYMDASQATYEAIWMQKILVDLFDRRMDPTVIYCNNQSCIKLFENPVFQDRSKHIDIWYHHLRDCVARRIMLLQYISTEKQDADI